MDVHLYTPNDYVGALMDLCQKKRGVLIDMKYLDDVRVDLHYALPLGEIVYDFFDAIKSRSRGYASYDYEFKEYRESDLVKLDFLLNGDPVDALSMIVFRDNAYAKGRRHLRKAAGQHPAQPVRDPGAGSHRRQDHCPRDRQGHAQGRAGQVLRRRYHPQEEAAGKAEGRQKEDAPAGQRFPASEAFTAVLKLDSDDN